jgi:hypothetical protein
MVQISRPQLRRGLDGDLAQRHAVAPPGGRPGGTPDLFLALQPGGWLPSGAALWVSRLLIRAYSVVRCRARNII